MERKKQQETIRSLAEDPVLAQRYELMEVVGEGCFGKIIKARNKRDNSICAIKLENLRKAKFKPMLRNEIQILRKLQGRHGIPKIYHYGEWKQGFFLEMELLEHDMNKPRTYSSSEITDLTLELLKILNEIHNENIIHQDLKPHNIMRSKENKLYIIDFGLAKHLSEDKNHYSIKGFIGTPRYASVRAHNMFEQSKKDDLESLFYNIAYLYYQKLPWSKLHVANEVKLEKIKTLKVRNRETLFDEMPLPFQKAFEYITGMRPFSEPDYSFLKGLFKRNKTVLVPNHREALEERSKMKRVSLNLSNFLQVPDVINEPRGKNLEDRDGNSSNGSRTKSINSFGVASDVILSQFLQFEEEDMQNVCETESEGDALPDISKYLQNVVLKNPFA